MQRKQPKQAQTRNILVIHQLLLGDAVMATSLLAHLRHKYPEADIDVAMPAFLTPLYNKKPYGINAIAYSPKDASSLIKLIRQKTYDLGIVIGDARYSWAAFAAGTRWIVTHAGDYPAYKNWFADELIALPETVRAMPDLMADLCKPDELVNYSDSDWQIPDVDITKPKPPYIIFHLGASSPLKLWPTECWLALGKKLKESGYSIVVTCGPGEESLMEPFAESDSFDQLVKGNFSLQQMWRLIDQATLLVSPDTGIAHIAKVTNTPLVCLFGPGPAELVGHSEFFSNHPARYLSKPIPCRDQPVIFKRPVSWLKFCERNTTQCDNPKCIKSITVDDVMTASLELLEKPGHN
ncbi:hypothetical protein ACH42_06760 [Endozoicomonas sp. (ex Bugula neritina AB1)]|nr:hypothetical protein ACH42_06760 [Endozoicomonas sp. (ex Bugula neritina AB1)]